MEDITNLARYVVLYESMRGRAVTHLRLQKLLYFIQGQHVSRTGNLCFEPEFEAWTYGPVVPKLYSQFKIYGPGNIILPSEENFNYLISNNETLDIINEVLEACSEFSTSSLIDISHTQKPWKYANMNGYKSTIKNKEMIAYFSS